MAYDIGPRIGIKGEAEFNNQIKKINNSLREYGSEMKALTSEFQDNENSQQSLIAKNKLLEKQLTAQQQKMSLLQTQYDKEVKKLKELGEAYQKISQEMGQNSTEAGKAEAALNKQAESVSKLKVAMNETDNYINKLNNSISKNSQMLDEIDSGARDAATGLKEMADGSEKAGDGVESLGKKITTGNLMQASEILQSVGDKLIEIGQGAIDAAAEWDDAGAKIQSNLNVTGEEAENLKTIAQNVFENGIADSVDVATEAVILCKQNFEELSGTDLENLSNQLVAISDRTETDLQENIRGASQLVEAFEVDGQKALDLIAAGYQDNLNKSGDFMDTLNEYSPLFSEAGFSAEQMLAVLSAGMENGALNTDKVADAVKELQIRMGDGSFEENIDMFSQSTKELFNEWENGDATVAQVAESIGQDLQKMTPTEQQKALSALSTQFEDLGIDASIALLTAANGFEDVTGKAKDFTEQTNSEKWQGQLREISDTMGDIGEKITGVLLPALETLSDFLSGFSELPAWAQTLVVGIGGIIAVFALLAPIISSVISIFSALGSVALGPIIVIIAAVIAAIVAIIAIIQNWGAISEWFKELWSSVCEWIKSAFQSVKDFFSGIPEWWSNLFNQIGNKAKEIKDKVVTAFQNLKDGVSQKIQSIPSTIQSVFNQAISFITSLPGKAYTWGSDFINGLKNGIKSKVNAIVNSVKNVANKIKSYLHFSRPDVGPLRDYETWMPDMMQGLAQTMYDNIYRVQNAASAVAGSISGNINGNINGAIEAASVTTSGMIMVEGDVITLDGNIIGRTAEKRITANQVSRLKAKGAHA